MTTAQQAVAGGVAKYIKGVVNTKPHLPGSNDVFWKKMRVAVSFSAAAVLVFLLLGAADAAYLHRLKPGENDFHWTQARADTLPESVDWREKGVVPHVIDQGQLGKDEAFTVTHSIDAYWAIKMGNLEYGSVTEVAECCMREHAVTSLDEIFSCIVRIGGLALDDDYPRNVTGKCLSQLHKPVLLIGGHRDVESFDEKDLTEAVVSTPVVALVDASLPSFTMYRSGVYSDKNCTTTKLDHSLLIVGYGSMEGEDYWICQNSWGTSWGMDGYILIARNAGNMCGIATKAVYPI